MNREKSVLKLTCCMIDLKPQAWLMPILPLGYIFHWLLCVSFHAVFPSILTFGEFKKLVYLWWPHGFLNLFDLLSINDFLHNLEHLFQGYLSRWCFLQWSTEKEYWRVPSMQNPPAAFPKDPPHKYALCQAMKAVFKKTNMCIFR